MKGVVLNKDGSFQRTAKFRGPDLDCAMPAELVGDRRPAEQRAAPSRLGLGDLCRGAASFRRTSYPHSHFPDAASALVDAERRAQFEEEGAHYESRAIS